MRPFMARICSASTLMSEACPRIPPALGWWIIVRECGSASRFPLVPPASRKEPIEAASPTLIVETSTLMWRIVSNMPNPAVTEPPGELMYIEIGFVLSSESR